MAQSSVQVLTAKQVMEGAFTLLEQRFNAQSLVIGERAIWIRTECVFERKGYFMYERLIRLQIGSKRWILGVWLGVVIF